MSAKEETYLQRRLQKLIRARGGYVSKNHGNMITEKGRADLSFTYKGLSFYWEVKTPSTATNVSEAQGIHCRLAQKAGGNTAIVSSMEMANTILDIADELITKDYPISTILFEMRLSLQELNLDDGTKY